MLKMKMTPSWIRMAALSMAVLCAATHAGLAQSTTQGGIAGTVFDSTDAVIPNATIIIHNNGTNAEIKLQSDGSGIYKAPQLAPATYTVTVSAPGFSDVRSSALVVQVDQVTEFNPHLATGAESTVIEVTTQAPVLNFESSAFGGHLQNTELENIPINNRRWSGLAITTPAVTPNSDGFGLLSFRAISPLLNNVQIDGADDNQAFFSEERGRTRAGYSTAQSAVREFQVNTGAYSAEFGRALGGVINTVTKSGSNNLHGELYFYNRNSGRSAFQPGANFTSFNSATNSYVTTPYKATDNRNQYGFGVGGPLVKDKVFWFYSFDQFKRNFPGTAKVNTPSSFFTAPDAALPAGETCNVATGAITGAPAATSIDKQACLLAARLGYATYAAGASAFNTQLQAFLPDLGRVPRFGDQTINTPKLDIQINQKEHVSFLYHRLRWDSPGGVQTQGTNAYAIDAFGTDFVKLDYGVAILDSLFTDHISNELRYQYGRELNDEGRQTASSYTNANLTNSTGTPVFVNLLGGSGTTCTSNIGFCLGTPYYSFRTAYPDERKWQIGDTASYVIGNHNIRVGEDFVHNFDIQNNVFEGNGLYAYSSNLVNYFSDLLGKAGTCDAAGSGIGALPCYNSLSEGLGPAVFQVSTKDYAVFVQDDWKATPRLTLNLGARYDYEALSDPYANLTTLPQTANKPSDKNNISPRIGLSWDPFGIGKTVVHAGYGMYYGRIFNAFLLTTYENTGSAGSQTTYTFSPTTTGAPIFPNIAASAPPPSALGPSIEYFDKNFQNPYAHEFDLAIQQDLGWGNVLSISYLGALGRELTNYVNTNLTNDSAHTYTFNYVVGAGSNGSCGPLACGTVLPVKVYSNKTQTDPTDSTKYIFNTPNPAYNAVTDVVSNINSSYHALSVEIQKRASKLISYDASYTWAHALDFNQSTSTSPSANNWFDPLGNARANYGNSNNDVKHRAVGWAIFNVPGLAGHGVATYVTNGWSLKPLVQIQSGLPYTLGISGTVPNQCYVANCLEAASSGLAGTGVSYIPAIGRNTFFNPRTIDIDLRVQKDFTIAEKYNLELFGEAFNLANHQNVTGVGTNGYTLNTVKPPTGNPSSPTSTLVYQPAFGGITSANSNNSYQVRQIQVAARITF